MDERSTFTASVKDVTTHPAFRNSVRMTARLYDAIHDSKAPDVLTCTTDTGDGGYTMRFFRSARSAKDLVGDCHALVALSSTKIAMGYANSVA
jgi:aromatic ring hydroxylase